MKYVFPLFLLLLSLNACAQEKSQNKYGLKVIHSEKDYQSTIRKHPQHELVEIQKAIPSVVLDIRYATTNNFMNEVMYAQPRAFARRPVVEKLKQIQQELAKKGYGLKIYDAYRPYTITKAFYEKASDKNFVANPAEGSKHNRGCAVDITLVDLKTGKELPMPTAYDSFTPQASPTYEKLSPEIKKNRDYLISIMHSHGFKVVYNEWWHFDFNGWQNYDLMDIPFEKL